MENQLIQCSTFSLKILHQEFFCICSVHTYTTSKVKIKWNKTGGTRKDNCLLQSKVPNFTDYLHCYVLGKRRLSESIGKTPERAFGYLGETV